MALFAARLQVTPMVATAAMAAMAAMVAAWQHPSPRKRILHAPQELPVNEA
jgi:3-deoxy-D-arabino-heptulosonate 7-phosphate (DAHP) synthase